MTNKHCSKSDDIIVSTSTIRKLVHHLVNPVLSIDEDFHTLPVFQLTQKTKKKKKTKKAALCFFHKLQIRTLLTHVERMSRVPQIPQQNFSMIFFLLFWNERKKKAFIVLISWFSVTLSMYIDSISSSLHVWVYFEFFFFFWSFQKKSGQTSGVSLYMQYNL